MDNGQGAVAGAAGAGRDPSSHQLRLFLVLAEELHFGRAAARTFMTQPAFSRQIRALEGHLGVTLVERTSRAVTLTGAGQALLPEIRAAAAAALRLRKAAGAYSREVTGRLILGFIGGEAAMPYTHAILTELRAQYPGITVEMRDLNLLEQFRAVTDGEVDAAFLRPPLPPGMQSIELATEPRVACLPTGDPLAARAAVTLADLADHLVVDVPREVPRAWWDHWTVNPRPDGTRVCYGPVVADVEAMLHAVASGQAILFLPAAARRLFPRPGVAYVDVTDMPLSTAALTWLAASRNRPVIATLRAVAHAVVQRTQNDAVQRTHNDGVPGAAPAQPDSTAASLGASAAPMRS